MSTAAVGACDDATDVVGNSGRIGTSSYAAIAMMVGRCAKQCPSGVTSARLECARPMLYPPMYSAMSARVAFTWS